jgi:CheY-like chemotaxis protein
MAGANHAQAAATSRSRRLGEEVRRRVAHDVRASLNTIAGWTEIVRQETTDDALRARAVDTIMRHVRQASRRLDDAMDLWRIDTDSLSVAPIPLHVPAIVRAAIAQVDAEARESRPTWRLTVDSEERYALADRARVQQAIVALLSHAAVHAPQGGPVIVRIEGRPSNVVVSIEDGGPPMMRDVEAIVFGTAPEPLHGSLSPGRRFDAGLVLARELIALQNGTLEPATSELGGLRIQVTLPGLAEGPAQAAIAEEGFVATRGQLRGIRVLVVDDEADAREALEGILRYHGAIVHSASSAGQALRTLEGTSVDVLLADIAMPGRDGYDLIRAIRRQRNMIPAVAVTAFAGEEDRTRALEAGYQVHLGKPAQPERLLATVLLLANRAAG